MLKGACLRTSTATIESRSVASAREWEKRAIFSQGQAWQVTSVQLRGTIIQLQAYLGWVNHL
jgi:hypothetical protein